MIFFTRLSFEVTNTKLHGPQSVNNVCLVSLLFVLNVMRVSHLGQGCGEPSPGDITLGSITVILSKLTWRLAIYMSIILGSTMQTIYSMVNYNACFCQFGWGESADCMEGQHNAFIRYKFYSSQSNTLI